MFFIVTTLTKNQSVQSLSLHPLDYFKKIEGYSCISAIEHYARIFGVNVKTASEHFEELLKYLCLSAAYPEALTPSDQLDEMWHSFIIQTRDYADFSELLGKFINHSTMSAPQASAYSNALIRYRSIFGEPHTVWLSKKLHHQKFG